MLKATYIFYANMDWSLKCLSLEMKPNPQWGVHEYKRSALTDLMFAESFVRKQNDCIQSCEIVLFFLFYSDEKTSTKASAAAGAAKLAATRAR